MQPDTPKTPSTPEEWGDVLRTEATGFWNGYFQVRADAVPRLFRAAMEKAWDDCTVLMRKTFPGWPEAAEEMRKANPNRALPSPNEQPQ